MRWVGTTFPGFFVMENRVIASVSLPGWPADAGDIFQSAVTAVDGRSVSNGREVYQVVATRPPGSRINYALNRQGRVASLVAASMPFTWRDYFLVFVPYLVSGLSLALIGIFVWYSKPETPASLALLLGGLGGGVFAITAADLYSPYWFFRLHVAAEASFPAALLIHLAAVFPVDRMRGWRWRRAIILLPYVAAAILTAAYERFVFVPAAYTWIHDLCMDNAGIGGALLLAAVTWDFFTSRSELVRQRIRILLLGFLCGFAFPGALMFYSGLTGGEIPVNYAGFTVILFPLSIGYAIVQHDLFEIDAVVKRSVYYITITAALGAAYLVFLLLTNWSLSFSSIAHWQSFPLLFTILVAFLLNPIKDGIQRTVDRVFFRLRYNPKEMLEATSAALASTLQLDEIAAFVWGTINATVGCGTGGIFTLAADTGNYNRIYPGGGESPLDFQDRLIASLRGGHARALSRYDLDSDANANHPALDALGAELVVPMLLKTELIGFIALGPKQSGKFFSNDDITFLHALANQSALSIANALAYREIQTLNAALERRVQERTAELSLSNHELQLSLERLENAYRDLQRSQEDLSRAEKLATLGRLAAGIAHEMNTPLGASMTNLKLLNDLVDEYRASAGDPSISPEDHRDIASEMGKLVSATRDWLNKAGAHIRSLKLHTRTFQTTEEQSFRVLDVIEDVRLLLAHRLRETQGRLIVENQAHEPLLYGDPAKLGQVLTNLISNAIDANHEAGRADAAVEIAVTDSPDTVAIQVSDRGVGISAENLPHIFEDFFSTKALGKGTGLGLSISRDIVSNFFRGTITAESVPGEGSAFTLRLPRRRPADSSVAA